MLTVHHVNMSRSHRILWLMEELGLDYEVVKYLRDAKTMLAPPELKKVHPLGKSPVITDGNLTIAESGAIIDYLLDAHDPEGRLRPGPGAPNRVAYLHWYHFAEGSAMTPLILKLWFSRMGEAGAPAIPRIDATIAEQLAYMESSINGRPYFAGETLTAADIQMSFPLEAAGRRGGLDQRYPNLQAWLKRIAERPAYRKAVERGA